MKGWEVVKTLEEGKRMKHMSWLSNEYIYLSDKKDIVLVDSLGTNEFTDFTALFLNGWEEYVEPLRNGDYVVKINGSPFTDGNTVSQINVLKNEGRIAYLRTSGNTYMDVSNLRKATPEEIKQELERRKWEKIGRQPFEYKAGDFIGWNGKFITLLNKEVAEGKVYFADIRQHIPLNKVVLVCPVENRFDVN